MTTPAVKADSQPKPPAAETGLVPRVVLGGEGAENDDAQDASRTTAETGFMPDPDTASRKRVPLVLIVEDAVELAEVLQATLERMNMRAIVESHGSRALARYHELKPDVLLLDIGLPDTSGWKLLESIKEKDAKQMPIVIVITAYGDAANRLVGKLQNVHSYLVKPFTPDQVEKVVAQALGSVG